MSVLLGATTTTKNYIMPFDFKEEAGKEVKAGTPLMLDTDGSVKKITASGDLFGIAGYKQKSSNEVDVIRKGVGIGVILDSGASSSLIGKKVYIDKTNLLFTDVASTGADESLVNNIPTNAIFTSDRTDGKNLTNSSLNATYAALIDLV